MNHYKDTITGVFYGYESDGSQDHLIAANPNLVLLNGISEITQPVTPPRDVRDALLLEVDIYTSPPLRWGSLTSTEQAAWSTYRQALLDVPQQADFPNNITWPTLEESP
jgi:hypothetical protein